LIFKIAPLRHRPKLLGISGGIECMAIATGPLIAGLITTYSSWRVCFYINIPIAVVTIIVTITCMRSPELSKPPDAANQFSGIWDFLVKVDVAGAMILTPMTICLLLALQWGGVEYPWNSAPIIATFVLSVLLLLAFGGHQYWKGQLATLQPAMMCRRSVVLGTSMTFCNSASLYIVGYYLLIWFQSVLSLSVFKAGVYDLPYDLGFIISIFCAGFITTWVGYYTPVMVVGSILMSVGAGLMTTFEPSTKIVLVFVYQIIFAVGNGLAYQQPYVAVQTVLDQDHIPGALALLTFAQCLGGAVSLAIAQAVFLTSLGSEGGAYETLADNGTGRVPTDNVDKLNRAVVLTFYVATGFSAFTMVSALGTNWNSVKTKPCDTAENATVKE
jgi:MFS family permease